MKLVEFADGRNPLAYRLNAAYNRMIEQAGGIEAFSELQLDCLERYIFKREQLRQIQAAGISNPHMLIQHEFMERQRILERELSQLANKIPGAQIAEREELDLQDYLNQQ